MISNPPYVPSPADRVPRNGRARAWEAGRDGRVFVDRLCAAAPRMLRPGGTLLVVHSDLCGTDTTLRRLEKAGLRASVVDRAEVPYGPVLRSRRPWLVHQGLIAEDDTQEEVVVIRAERP